MKERNRTMLVHVVGPVVTIQHVTFPCAFGSRHPEFQHLFETLQHIRCPLSFVHSQFAETLVLVLRAWTSK